MREAMTVMKTHDTQTALGKRALWLLALALAFGCARAPGVPGPDGTERSAGIVARNDASDAPALDASASDLADDDTDADYDPWQPFNEAMFSFNHDVLDRWLVKPAATGWEAIMPEGPRRSIARAFDNLDMPRKVVNNILQFRPIGAGRELARFLVNTTVGVGGLFDVASVIHLQKSDADGGQTLALYGFADGPYLVLPTMPPATVRDAIGRTADGFLDPIGYFMPFVANRARAIVTAVNERSLNLKLYADVEDSVLDLYSAARNGYLQRRRLVVRRAAVNRHDEWQWVFKSLAPGERPTAVAVASAKDPS